MKINFWKIIPILLFLLLLTACEEHVELGQYKVMGVKLTSETKVNGQAESIFKSMPVFTFKKGKEVEIKPDFSFGYFKDTLFTYKLKDGYLYLKGKNIEHKIMCESYLEGERPSYELYLGTKYVTQIRIIKEPMEN